MEIRLSINDKELITHNGVIMERIMEIDSFRIFFLLRLQTFIFLLVNS